MIRVTTDDLNAIVTASALLKDMYVEVYGDNCSKNDSEYLDYIMDHPNVFIGENNDCLLLVKDATPTLLLEGKLWDGEAVYIVPEKRKSKLLYAMYQFMFDTFEGSIVGMVSPGSEHDSVVAKRGKLLGTMYTFNKETFKKGI